MATITGLTAARMLEIEAASIVDGEVVGDNLILTKHDASTINAGSVRGPQGDPGDPGSDLVVVTAQGILDVGMTGQIRAGRQLTASDFTNMGLSAPIGLWNLGNTSDSSGNGRTLTNKGTVTFTNGIMGAAASAAQFSGSAAQALYIADTGGSDPFRIRVGSVGCWMKTAKLATFQGLVSKFSSADGNRSWWLQVNTANQAEIGFSPTGNIGAGTWCVGTSNICDNRWHFVVGVWDGARIRLYVDGYFENEANGPGLAFSGTAPLNVGSHSGDSGTSSASPSYGVVDEAFVSKDILTEEQIRNLYCAKIGHSLGAVPKRASLNVTRRRKGAALVTGDFSSTPLRLYNFSAGALTDLGSNNVTLTASGTPVKVGAVDGSADNAMNFDGTDDQLTGTDTGLPSGTNARSFGCWMKCSTISNSPALMSWGSSGTTTASECLWLNGGGTIVLRDQAGADVTGTFVADGVWHFVVAVEDNSALDGVKRKLYLDGVLVGGGTTLGSITLSGANRFRIGMWADGTGTGVYYKGNIDSAFVTNYAMTPEEMLKLYNKGAMALGISPKAPGDNVELMTSTDLYCIFDTVEAQNQIDLAVA